MLISTFVFDAHHLLEQRLAELRRSIKVDLPRALDDGRAIFVPDLNLHGLPIRRA